MVRPRGQENFQLKLELSFSFFSEKKKKKIFTPSSGQALGPVELRWYPHTSDRKVLKAHSRPVRHQSFLHHRQGSARSGSPRRILFALPIMDYNPYHDYSSEDTALVFPPTNNHLPLPEFQPQLSNLGQSFDPGFYGLGAQSNGSESTDADAPHESVGSF